MRYLSVPEILELHRRVIEHSGGASGIRDRGALESAQAQPMMTFGGEDLYPGVLEKAAVLGFSLVSNHPFIDGSKRIGHAHPGRSPVANRAGAGVDDDPPTSPRWPGLHRQG